MKSIIWNFTQLGAYFIQTLGKDYTVIIPEKFYRVPTEKPGTYYENIEDRKLYIIENLLECYVSSINGYLNEHAYSSIVLMGTSESGILLPLIYEGILQKEK